MAAKSKLDETPKRLNRTVGAGEALAKALDPAFRKRGFASRDIITHWSVMAPVPYDKVAAPDRLAWPRAEREAGGAVLYLRCAPGHALALAHEGQKIAASINRYFGYVLVSAVRLSAEPFIPRSVSKDQAGRSVTAETKAEIERRVGQVADDGVRDALRRLGHGIMGKPRG